MPSFIIYTAILGGYDLPPDFVKTDPNIKYVCFTDSEDYNLHTPWEIVPISGYFKDPKFTSGFFKCNADMLFGNDVISAWVDGNLKRLNIDSELMLRSTQKNAIATPPHLIRNTIAEETKVVVELNLEDPATAIRHLQNLAEDGYPDDQGLSATMVVIRDHRNINVRKSNASWWSIIASGVRRDQLSFNYVLWKHGLKWQILDIDWRIPNALFTRVDHIDTRMRTINSDNTLLHKCGNSLAMPDFGDTYPREIYYTHENWSTDTLATLRELNSLIHLSPSNGIVEGNYCHFHNTRLTRLTPPDLRRSWKREYLRRAVRGCRNGLEVGFNAGHSATVLLGSEPGLSLTSVDLGGHDYSQACANFLSMKYGNRFKCLWGDSKLLLPEIDVSRIDFVHIDGGHDPETATFDLEWFGRTAPVGCLLLVDDSYDPYINQLLTSMVEEGILSHNNPGFPSTGENLLFAKLKCRDNTTAGQNIGTASNLKPTNTRGINTNPSRSPLRLRTQGLEHQTKQRVLIGNPNKTSSQTGDLPEYFQHLRSDILNAVPVNAGRVLDVGCGAGMLGKAIKERNPSTYVEGIEFNKAAAKMAAGFLDKAHHADVETFSPPFTAGTFDCIIFADILEHLRDPWKTIKDYVPFLQAGGSLVASIPNIKQLSILRNLIQHDTWEYADEGILDRTHLRFFTRSGFQRLLEDAGIRQISCQHLGTGEFVAYSPIQGIVSIGNIAISHVDEESFKDLSALQFLFTGIYAPHEKRNEVNSRQQESDRSNQILSQQPLSFRTEKYKTRVTVPAYSGSLISLQKFHTDGTCMTDSTPEALPVIEDQDSCVYRFNLADTTQLNSLRVDLHISLVVAKVQEISLMRKGRADIDLTSCMVTNGVSFGNLLYLFEGTEPPFIGFAPLSAHDLTESTQIRIRLKHFQSSHSAIAACIDEIRKLPTLPTMANQKQVAALEALVSEQNESIQKLLTLMEKQKQALGKDRAPVLPRPNIYPLTAMPIEHNQPGKIALHLHIYYMDMADELLSHFAMMPFTYDLFITIVDKSQTSTVEQKARRLCGNGLADLTVLEVPNRGRDIAAFLVCLKTVYSNYDFICHVHSKKSLYTGKEQTDWCLYLFQSLFKDESYLRGIFGVFRKEKKIGIVYPTTPQLMPYWCHSWLSNNNSARALFNRLKIKVDTSRYVDYPVGSMFWARTDALKPLFDLDLSFNDFPAEPIPNDGTLSHAIERSFCICANMQGYTFTEVDIVAEELSVGNGKKNLLQYWSKSAAHLHKMLQQFQTISFDIFDTIITRPLIHPDHAFLLLQHKISKELALSIDFLTLRKEAEARVRQQLQKGTDADIHKIYACFCEITGLPSDLVERIKQMEFTNEIRLAIPRKDMLDLVKRLQAEGKSIAFLSDMYLTSSEIAAILGHQGLDLNDIRLLVSAETGLRKDSGEVWRHFLKNVAQVHVGDNEHSDIQLAADNGIPQYHVMSSKRLSELCTPRNSLSDSPTLADSLYAGPVIARIFSSPFALHRTQGHLHITEPKEMGYCIFGPLMLYFTAWLHRSALETGTDRLLFLAREGFLLQQLFAMYSTALSDTTIENTYLLCSRRANSVPTIESDKDILALLAEQYTGNLANLLESRFGIDVATVSSELNISRKSLFERSIRLPHDAEAIKSDVLLFKKAIHNNVAQERNTYRKYLEGLQLDPKKKTAVVDIGFAGTIQKYLHKLTGITMNGFYFITNNKAKANPLANLMSGCFGEFAAYQSGSCVYDYSLIIEAILTAPAGQLERFDENMNPVFREAAHTQTTWPSLRAIHMGIIDYCKDAIRWFGDALLLHEPDMATATHFFRLMAEHPEIISQPLRAALQVDDFYVSGKIVDAFAYNSHAPQIAPAPLPDVQFVQSFLKDKSQQESTAYRSHTEFVTSLTANNHKYEERLLAEKMISNLSMKENKITLTGYCDCCGTQTEMTANWNFSEASLNHKAYVFNHAHYADWYGKVLLFREHLSCSTCGLNNRQRGIFYAIEALGLDCRTLDIYVYEQTTPFYAELAKKNSKVIGSEYLGDKHKAGKTYQGIRHEDALNLSFANDSFDLLISNDVFEHVPDIAQAMKESLRVLRPGGYLVYSIPFDMSRMDTAQRALITDGQLVHLEEAAFHGNPVSDEGSLVFYDFGWDILKICRSSGFSDAYMLGYYAADHGLMGGGIQVVFVGKK